MFIYTVKASRLKFFALIFCAISTLMILYAVIPNDAPLDNVAVVALDYSNASTNEDRIEFITSLGYKTENTPCEIADVIVPETFDSVYEKYNEIQRAQGLNLKKFKGKTVTRYTYKVCDYPKEGTDALVNLLIYNGNIIGGDVCSSSGDSFLHGFEQQVAD